MLLRFPKCSRPAFRSRWFLRESSSGCRGGRRGDTATLNRWLPDRPIDVPIYMAGQGPKARALAKEITDGLISLGGPAEGFETCLVSTSGTVLDDGEDITSPRASTAVKPLV